MADHAAAGGGGIGIVAKFALSVILAVGAVVAVQELGITYEWWPPPASRLEDRARRAAAPPISAGSTAAPQQRIPQGHATAPPTQRAPTAPVPGEQYSIDCAKAGGHRVINPNTGKRSCWVPNRP